MPAYNNWQSKFLFKFLYFDLSMQFKTAVQITALYFVPIFSDAKACHKTRPFAPEKNEETIDRPEAELNKME